MNSNPSSPPELPREETDDLSLVGIEGITACFNQTTIEQQESEKVEKVLRSQMAPLPVVGKEKVEGFNSRVTRKDEIPEGLRDLGAFKAGVLESFAKAAASTGKKRKFDTAPPAINRVGEKVNTSTVRKITASTAPRPRKASSSSPLPSVEPISSEFDEEMIKISEHLQCSRSLWDNIFDFQREGVLFLDQRRLAGRGALLADEMGLGKTIQVSVFLSALKSSDVLDSLRARAVYDSAAVPLRRGHVLIVTPATLTRQWKQELKVWCGNIRSVIVFDSQDVVQDSGSSRVTWAQAPPEDGETSIVLVSFESFRIYSASVFYPLVWTYVILDEAQKIRNPSSGVSEAIRPLSLGTSANCICLSGSPIQNSLRELWSIVDFVSPGLLGTLDVFESELALPIQLGAKPTASKVQVEVALRCSQLLRELVHPLILRRVKSDVAMDIDLPSKTEHVSTE
jgi:SNF2 family DNA or RNA helicase